MAALKQYGPGDLADELTLSVLNANNRGGPLEPFITYKNPSGMINGDGIALSWTGDRQLTIGWPSGATAVTGPGRVGGVQITYTPYEPDLGRLANDHVRKIRLTQVSVGFRETHSPSARSRQVANGGSAKEVSCIVQLTGVDNVYLHRVVSAFFSGNGIGTAADGPALAFGGVSVAVAIAPGTPSSTPSLTRAEIGGIFPVNDASSAPGEAFDSVSYKGLTAGEAQKIFAVMRAGSPHIRIAFGLGSEAIDYVANVEVPDDVVERFNACSAKTNIYGAAFTLAP